MCLAADVPLIESGTAGYMGQVTVVKKVRFCFRLYFIFIIISSINTEGLVGANNLLY